MSASLARNYLLVFCRLSFCQSKTITWSQKTSSFEVYPRYVKRIFETYLPLITDVLMISALEQQTACSTLESAECGPLITSETELYDSSRLVELLQQSAVEHLTTYRQFTARYFASVVTIVTTDFEALYAFKHSNYELCFQLSRQNVLVLLRVASGLCNVRTLPVFIPLFDDVFVSLIALMMITIGLL